MRRKIAALAVLAAAFVVAPATGTVAHAEPYSPKIPTQTHIEVTVQGPGEPIILHVSGSANYEVPPEGTIDVQVSAGGTAARGARSAVAAPLFTTSVHFVDDPVRIEGPALPRGRYIAAAQLTPDNGNLFLPSDTVTGFRVGVSGGGPGGDADGGLPGTGGPDLMWLVLGGALLAAGAGGVTYSRRRSTATAA